MCGRFTLTAGEAEIAALFDLDDVPLISPRYNIAPTQPVAAIRLDRAQNKREFTYLTWGLVPSWSKDPSIGSRMINARSETVAEKPSFRAAFKRRRCLIPASGFYEWQKQNGQKQPYHIGMANGGVFSIAGLWEYWESSDGSTIQSCTLMTTTPNELVATLHNRMPVIIDPLDYDDWLSPNSDPGLLMHLLRAYPADDMQAYPVSRTVNSPMNDSPECIQPLELDG